MFLEGEVNWVLVLGVIAAVSVVVALIALWFAITGRVQHVSASDQLDLVQKVASAADKRLFQTLNAIPVALVETDKNGKFVFANRAAHQLLGRRDAELLGLRFHSATWGVTYPDGRAIPPDLLPSARALRGQTVKGFQHLMANPATRRKMLVSVTAMPIENELGEITGSTAAIVEIEGLTTPEALQPALEAAPAPVAQTDALTRRVFEAASSALIVVDAAGRVREANRTALILLGAQTPPVDADFADLFVPEAERDAARQALRAALAAPAGEAAPLIAAYGAEGAVRWSLLPLAGPDGAPDALLLAGERHEAETAVPDGQSQEITTVDALVQQAQQQAEVARAEAEAARQLAARIEAEARAEIEASRRLENVGRLTGGVAHDFNALLGVMTSALDMMLKQAEDPSRVRRLGQAALAAGQRGEVLTRRLTAFAQGDDGQGLQVMDLSVLLRGLETRLRADLPAGLDLMVEAPPQPCPARIDPVAFDGAVRALVANAFEAVGPGGSVAVRLERMAEGGLRLSVRDNGPGMDRELVARAIEPFFTTKPSAAGLGLSQAYAFARQAGGRLSIDSGPAEGAEVSILLPEAA